MAKNSAITSGTLYIVATPIGNRDDMTLRALNVLRSVDAILAEDTRHSLPFLAGLGIKKPLISFHAHNENEKSQQMIEALLDGQSLALISDAGTPLICDPGFPLVHLARQRSIPVVPIPGPCALIAALSASGLPLNAFIFGGFLPAKQSLRLARLKEHNALNYTLVFYESSHRIQVSLQDIATAYGENYEFILIKELTKTFEQFIEGTGEKLLAWLQEEPQRKKGEFVLLLPPRECSNDTDEEAILKLLLEEMSLKSALKIAEKITGLSKNRLYETALRIHRG